MEETIRLSDGTVMSGNVIESDGRLYVYLNDTTLVAAFPLLANAEKTAVMVATQYGEETTYRGYSHLTAISEEDRGMVSAVMKKAVSGNV